MKDDKCPFKGYKNMACDFIGIKHEDGSMQCPTQIFNKCMGCQEATSFNEDDQKIIEKTLNKLKQEGSKTMYTCEICKREYDSVWEYAACVSKCSEKLKKKEEAKRLEEANAALNKVKQAKAHYQEQLDNFKKKYPTEYKMYLFNNDGVNECPYDCKGFVVNE